MDLRPDLYMARETRHGVLVPVVSPYSILSYGSQGVLRLCSMQSEWKGCEVRYWN
jgi:hypothetical protein